MRQRIAKRRFNRPALPAANFLAANFLARVIQYTWHCRIPAVGPCLRSGLLALAISSCTTTQQAADATTIEIYAKPLALHENAPKETTLGPLEYLGGLQLTSPTSAFGGLSGLSISSDGRRLVAVTDKGRWLRARLVRDPNGAVKGLAEAEMRPLHGLDGRPLRVGSRWRDSEAIERVDPERYLVSFEGRHRLYQYDATPEKPDPLRGIPVSVPVPKLLRKAPVNSGLEAIAALNDGQLLLLSEGFYAADGFLHAWILGADGVRRMQYKSTAGFRPTDLAPISGDRLLVLERQFSVVGGFTNRLAYIDVVKAQKTGTIETVEIARFQPPIVSDNFEGLAALPKAGGYEIFILSDDNFFFLQRTLLLQFFWPDKPPVSN